ncbi:MAG: FtsW/RodA/SpoVE family cell cycle protein [Oscillospiraceae bacterium]|jgi:rod shape determining protein RodA|nr:FtsW/RodA/SpoVE family cell cycle protein [Oscillospiraceae bacterium]
MLVFCIIASLYGLLLVSSASRVNGRTNTSQLVVQSIGIVLGIGAFVVLSKSSLSFVRRRWIAFSAVGLLFIMSLLVFGKGGDETGNQAWIRFTALNIGIQPAEVVKLPFIIIVAHLFSKDRETSVLNMPANAFRAPLLFLVFAGTIVIVSGDLGSSLVYLFILIFMTFSAGIYKRWILLEAAFAGGGVVALWNFVLKDTQKNRILAPYDPSIDPTGRNITWQPRQSAKAIADGGLFGQGLYKGRLTQAGAIPQQHTDFIFSAAGEEFGFIGCMLIITLQLIIIGRCIYIGCRTTNKFSHLICIGVAGMLIGQMVENIGMCLALLPVVGITLPFFSYGGTSVMVCFATVGLVAQVKYNGDFVPLKKAGRRRYMSSG